MKRYYYVFVEALNEIAVCDTGVGASIHIGRLNSVHPAFSFLYEGIVDEVDFNTACELLADGEALDWSRRTVDTGEKLDPEVTRAFETARFHERV